VSQKVEDELDDAVHGVSPSGGLGRTVEKVDPPHDATERGDLAALLFRQLYRGVARMVWKTELLDTRLLRV
jgi:hypothetical protein